MHLVILIAVVVLGSSVFIYTSKNESQTPQTLGESTTSAPTPTPQTPGVTSSPSPTITSIPTVKPPISTPIPKATATPIHTSTLVYPNSSPVSLNKYTSSDDTDKITDWYEEQIRSQGYNAKSFVRSTSNGVVNNVLAASKSGSSIKVEITKSSSSSQVYISLVLDK